MTSRRTFLQFAGSLIAAASLRLGSETMERAEGDERVFESPSGKVRCVLVRNVSGKTLLPNRFVSMLEAGRIGGYATSMAAVAGIVMCSRNGVPNGRLFWLAKNGLVKVQLSMPRYIHVA